MSDFNVIAIDLAKTIFQVCKTTPDGKVVFNRTMSRQQLKAFRQGQKTDANDALAIAVAARQPHIKATRLLSLEEQCLQGMERSRELLVKQKVAISNHIRGLLLELGFAIGQGDGQLQTKLSAILEDGENDLSIPFREALFRLWQRFKDTAEDIMSIDSSLKDLVKQDQDCQRLTALEGVGIIGALKLKIVLADGNHFKSGREASACIGVTPVQHSSSGKENIGSISKSSGNQSLRSVLFKGALSVVCSLERRECRTHKDKWLKALSERRGMKVAAIALANKNIRTAYAMLKQNKDYQPSMLTA